MADYQTNDIVVRGILDKLDHGEMVTETEYEKLLGLNKNTMSWDVFQSFYDYAGILNEKLKNDPNNTFLQEQLTKANWGAAKAVEVMMAPKLYKYRENIATIKGKASSEDFMMEASIEIFRVISERGWDPNKAKFPIYLNPFLQQLAYAHDREISAYMDNKIEGQVFQSYEQLTESIKAEENSGDKLFSKMHDTSSLFQASGESVFLDNEKIRKSNMIMNAIGIDYNADADIIDTSDFEKHKTNDKLVNLAIYQKFLGEPNNSVKKYLLMIYNKNIKDVSDSFDLQ